MLLVLEKDEESVLNDFPKRITPQKLFKNDSQRWWCFVKVCWWSWRVLQLVEVLANEVVVLKMMVDGKFWKRFHCFLLIGSGFGMLSFTFSKNSCGPDAVSFSSLHSKI